MHTEDLMTRSVHTCLSTDTLAAAARTMWERDVGWLPVLTPDGQLVSVVTDRDVCMGALLQGQTLAQSNVRDVMSRRLVTCSPDDDVAELERKMRQEQIRRLPVVGHDGHLLGVVTLSDIVRGLEREIDDAERSIRLDHQRRDAHGVAPELAAAEALSDVVDASRALYQGCSHALDAVDTLAAICEPRGPNSERVSLRKPIVDDVRWCRCDDDDIWMYE